MIKFLISLFLPFRWFIIKSGADYEQFISILKLKLTIDDRRSQGQNTNKKASVENSILKQSISQIIVGFLFGMMLLLIKSEFTFFYLAHIVLMVMMAMLIISDFTTILFDTSENTIIQPLPIRGNTISLARNAHIFLYLGLIAFNFSVVSMIIAIIKFGFVSFILFFFSIFLNVLFTLFLANILYLGIMHIVSGEKLKNLMMYFQIAIAVLFMAGYQIGIQSIGKAQLMNMSIPIDWYTFLIPSAIFSGMIEAFSKGVYDLNHLIFIAEALILPFATAFFTTKYLTPIFNRKLLNLEQGDRATKVKTSSGKTSLYFKIASGLFVKQKDENAAFHLVWRMSGYERLFKQSYFPSLAYIFIMIAAPFFKGDQNLTELASSSRYLLLLYSFLLVSLTLSTSLIRGNNSHIDWMYKILPICLPADYFKGFIKAVFVRFFLPFFLLISIGIVLFWGVKIIPDVIIAFLAIYMFTLIIFYLQKPLFPFSQATTTSQGGKNVVLFLGLLFIAFLLGGLHYLVAKWHIFGLLTLATFYIITIYFINKKWVYKLIDWKKIGDSNTYN